MAAVPVANSPPVELIMTNDDVPETAMFGKVTVELAFRLPLISNLVAGPVVPMPTEPEAFIAINSVDPPLNKNPMAEPLLVRDELKR